MTINMRNKILLKPGDKIGICAPSGSFDKLKFEKGLEVIKNMGFNPIVPKDIYKKKRYLAGSDPLRAKVITDFLIDDNIKAIMCARGGFGAIRILDLLERQLIQRNTKFFIGFSDITALLVNLTRFPLIKLIHGPNIVSLAKAESETVNSLYQSLTNGTWSIKVNNPVVLNRGFCKARLLGGNLTTLNHLVGTKYQAGFKDCIFFMEDIQESPYKIDRMLTQMKLAGCFNGIKGVVTGSFQNCGNLEIIHEIIQEIFEEYHIPILAGVDSGHGRINLSLPMGVEVTVDTDKTELEFNR